MIFLYNLLCSTNRPKKKKSQPNKKTPNTSYIGYLGDYVIPYRTSHESVVYDDHFLDKQLD